MANFSIIALKILAGNTSSIKKVLKEDWYLFNQSYKVEKEKLVRNKDYPLSNDFFGKNISVSAIVGKNGSGKSSLLELMYRIINNFTFWLVKKQQRNAAERFFYIDNVYADLYFEINGKLGVLHCRGSFVGFQLGDEKYGFNHFAETPPEFQSYKIHEKELLVKEFVEIAKSFFYTIVTNYSMFAFLDSDYEAERGGYFDADGKSGYNSDGIWINSMFHKNDGYSAPIALNPYRDSGTIYLANEAKLTKQRLAAILIESKKKNKQFIDDYQLNRIEYKYVPTNILRKFKAYNDINTLRQDFVNAWNHENGDTLHTYTSVILNQFGYTFSANLNEKQIDAYIYLVYKSLSIASKYPSYSNYFGLATKPKSFFERTVDSETKVRLENLVKYILKDKSHITLKITQTRNFLNKCDIQELSRIQDKDFDFTYDDYEQTFQFKKKLSGLYEIMEFLPPPFFDYEIKLDKIVDNKITSDIPFQTMSSGEKQFLYAVSTLIYHIKNLRSIQQKHRVKYRHFNLVLDEVELCFHPEMQRLFVNKLIGIIKRLGLTNHNCSFNIIFATHSPFILSDIPNCNVMYLQEGEQKPQNEMPETFASNINDILRHSFFLENGFIGEFAQKKIGEVIKAIKGNKIAPNNYKEYKQIIDLIGEPLIKNKLMMMISEVYDNVEDRIEMLRKEIENLENLKK